MVVGSRTYADLKDFFPVMPRELRYRVYEWLDLIAMRFYLLKPLSRKWC